MVTLPVLVVAFLVIAAMLFVPMLRRVVSGLIRLAIFAVGLAAAVAGVAMLMNNETPFEAPGAQQRITRFLTVNSAAVSASGTGSKTCDMGDSVAPKPEAAAQPAQNETGPAAKKAAADQRRAAAKARQNVTTPAAQDDVYPELIRRGYPGISRQKLFQLSQDTVNSLAGWKIVKADSRNYTLDCIYSTRILGFEDDVRITVMPSGDIDVCSRSGTARPGSTSMLRYFPGDLGANIGHIKEFYEVLEPKMDQVYKDEQDRENAKKPH